MHMYIDLRKCLYILRQISVCVSQVRGAPLHVEWALCVVQYMSHTVLTVTCACSQCGVLSATLHRGKPAVRCSQCCFNHYCADHCRVSPQGLTQCTQQTRVGRGMQEGGDSECSNKSNNVIMLNNCET